jgi:hypothetical protein
MRTIVVVSDTLAYTSGIPIADYSAFSAERAVALMDLFVAKYRAAGWEVVEHRPERRPIADGHPWGAAAAA